MIREPRIENQQARFDARSIFNPQCSIPLILLLALLLRLLLWSQPLHQPANDEIEYITVARDLLAGRGWQFYEHYRWLRAPLYPLFLAASLWLAGGDLHRAALPNIALSVANVYLSYRLTRALAGPRAANIAALLTAILWTLATFASLYMSETLFTFLMTGGLLCLVQRPPTDGEGPGWSVVGRRSAVIGAGILFGLATLTRSSTLLFLPIVALWLLLRRPPTPSAPTPTGVQLRAGADRRPMDKGRDTVLGRLAAGWFSVLGPLLFMLCSLLVIAPWTIRNQLAYGRPILVETGLSFNLWFFNEPRESNDEIYHTLERIPNPAERSDYATTKGLARLHEDPAILLRNLWPNWVVLWSVDKIEDRFLMESYYADVGLPLFVTALLLDDLLYPLLLLAGVAGLMLRRSLTTLRRRTAKLSDPKWLIVAWILYIVMTVLLTHGEPRYRHFLFPALIPYAAWALTHRQGDTETSRGGSVPVSLSPYLLVIAVLGAVILGKALGAYPWDWATQNLARGWHILIGDLAWAAGDRAGAARAYERATDAQETPDGWLRRGDAARALGDLPGALHAYREARHIAPPYIAASARLGDLLRALGDESGARAAFKGDYADPQRVADWSWRNLRPAPTSQLDVGDGLDFGYVGGVYPAEKLAGETARWTNGRGIVRLAGAGNDRSETSAAPELVRLRLAAPRPTGSAVRAEVCAAGRCWVLKLEPTWRDYVVPFNGVRGESLNIEIRSDTFRPRDYDRASPDDRALGVLVSRGAIVTPALTSEHGSVTLRYP